MSWNLPAATKSSNYTLTTTDAVIYGDASLGDITLTLPPLTGIDGRIYHIKKIDSTSNSVIIDGDGSELVEDSDKYYITFTYESVSLQADENGSRWIIL